MNKFIITIVATSSMFLIITGNVLAVTLDIKADGSDGPVSVSSGSAVSLTISLTAEAGTGQNADWWLIYTDGATFNYYNLSGNWSPGLIVSHQGPLFDLSATSITVSNLPAGSYTFYFGVDTVMNGTVDTDSGVLFYDTVVVNVTGHITYTLPGGDVYRIAAQEGATPENISQALNALAPYSDDGLINISPDGAWLVLNSERFDSECVGWSCLSIVAGDLSFGEAVRAGGAVIHPEGFIAVASGGNLIVYKDGGGPHVRDLWAVTRSGASAWGVPVLLTASSPYAYNDQPAISVDGSRVVFDCGNQPYGVTGTAICEAGTDGTGFRVMLTPADSPAGFPNTGALHHADYAPDGSIVFESNWDGEEIWRLPVGTTEPVRVASQFNNDNSPCVLPDGRIVSLWLGRPENESGIHEIKVMASDGISYIMALTGSDLMDIGIGCGE